MKRKRSADNNGKKGEKEKRRNKREKEKITLRNEMCERS